MTNGWRSRGRRLAAAEGGGTLLEYLSLLALLGLAGLVAVRALAAAVTSTGGRVARAVGELRPLDAQGPEQPALPHGTVVTQIGLLRGPPARTMPPTTAPLPTAQPEPEQQNPISGALNWLGDKLDTAEEKAASAFEQAKQNVAGKLDELFGWEIRSFPSRVLDAQRTEQMMQDQLERGARHNERTQQALQNRLLNQLALRDWNGAANTALDIPKEKIYGVAGDAMIRLGNKADQLQTLIAESPGRSLEHGELDTLRSVFGESIDYDAVRLKEGPLGLWDSKPGGPDATGGPRPMTMGNTIYMHRHTDPETLVHEMMHVWQHQHGGNDYIPKAQLPQLRSSAAAYRWTDDVGKLAWRDLSPEKQAELISDAYEYEAFGDPPHRLTQTEVKTIVAKHTPKGETPPPVPDVQQVNRYLEAAIEELRAGRGAP
ncbi:MAG TPA: hypothetical protein VJR89_37330 [Polyangiales bacterium]|nr:hypothetical protein [Polyangiales bacterium]